VSATTATTTTTTTTTTITAATLIDQQSIDTSLDGIHSL
jgi:hypothetical protein